jgi:hypothetical protein
MTSVCDECVQVRADELNICNRGHAGINISGSLLTRWAIQSHELNARAVADA